MRDHRAGLTLSAALLLTCVGCSATPASSNSTKHAAIRPSTSSVGLPTTSTPLALTPRVVGGFTIDVPSSWKESVTNNGGSFYTYTFSESGDPENLTATVDFCTGCIRNVGESATTDTVPYLQEETGASGESNIDFLSPYRATFDFSTSDSLTGYGIVDINSQVTTAIEAKIAVRADDAQLAKSIISSIR